MSERVTGSDRDRMFQELRATGLPMPDDMQHRVVAGALALKASVSRLSNHLGERAALKTVENHPGEAPR